MTKYFGSGSTLTGDTAGLTLTIPATILAEKGLLGMPEGASEDKLAIALLNTLYSSCKDKSDDATWLLSSQSIFPGRSSIGIESPATFNTYDFNLQVRVPSSDLSELPDPDF